MCTLPLALTSAAIAHYMLCYIVIVHTHTVSPTLTSVAIALLRCYGVYMYIHSNTGINLRSRLIRITAPLVGEFNPSINETYYFDFTASINLKQTI